MVTKMLEGVTTSVVIVIVRVVLSVQVARAVAVVSVTATRVHQVATAKVKSLVSIATDDLAPAPAIGREGQGIRWVHLRQREEETLWVRESLVMVKKGAEVAAEGTDHPEKIGGKIEDAKGRVRRA
jgi:hypothetical protein